LLKTIKISILKNKLKRLYEKYHKILDQYSCGKNLAEHISSDLSHIKTQFNDTIIELKKIDPLCPEFKL